MTIMRYVSAPNCKSELKKRPNNLTTFGIGNEIKITYGYVINTVISCFLCPSTKTHYCKFKEVVMLSVVCFFSK